MALSSDGACRWSIVLLVGLLALTGLGLGASAGHSPAEISPSDGAERDRFGASVGLGEDTIAVGAPLADGAADEQGRAYVFTLGDDGWTEQARLEPPSPEDMLLFGKDVALDGGTLLVGAPRADGAAANEGAAYVYTRSDRSWNLSATLRAGDPGADDRFGASVALEEDTALVGAPLEDGTGWDRGAAYVFVRSGDSWTQEAKLQADDLANNDRLGTSLAIDGGSALVGAPTADGSVSDQGAAYLFVSSDDAGWTQQARLEADQPEKAENAGTAVALADGTALLGAPLHDGAGHDRGVAYAFTETGDGWEPAASVSPPDARDGDRFGAALVLGGDQALVGAPGRSDERDGQGEAYLYEAAEGSLARSATLSAPDPRDRGRFGMALERGSERIVVGSPGAGEAGTVFVHASAPDVSVAIDPSDPHAGEPVSFSATAADGGQITGWQWDFGDGASATGPEVTHTFAGGSFEVCLTVRDGDGHTARVCRSLSVAEGQRSESSSPSAAFSYAPEAPSPGQTVRFTDESAPESGIAAHRWAFGEGTTATGPEPTHAFAEGAYRVCLTVESDDGATDRTCRPVTVTDRAFYVNFTAIPMEPRPGEPVSFKDRSLAEQGNVTGHSWDFGDGATSNRSDPTHTFESGTYRVCLTAEASQGGHRGEACRKVTVEASSPPDAFTFTPDRPSPGEEVTFAMPDGVDAVGDHRWAFGDGNTSLAANPSHAFASQGTYRVCLEVQGSQGDTRESCRTVNVSSSASARAPAPSAVAVALALFAGTALAHRRRR